MYIKVLIIILVYLGSPSYCSSENPAKSAVQDLIHRILGQVDMFQIDVNPDLHKNDDRDMFMISSNSSNSTIHIVATSGVGAAAGFHYYLKMFCKAHVSWDFDQLNTEACQMEDVNVTIVFNDKFRFYQNVCTQSYSFVWWDWSQWQRHLDWMMMQGFNLVPVMHDQEDAWTRVYRILGMTDDEIQAHFTGPAFIAWNRMGNLRDFAGPLPPSWMKKQAELAVKIATFLRQFGVTVVRPAFAGQVPRAMKRLFPNSTFYDLPAWNGFTGNFSPPLLLDPKDELFSKIANTFLNESFHVDDAMFSCDTFNEMTPFTTDLQVLKQIGHAIYKGITNSHPNATWILQGWLFHHDRLFWTEERAEAFLTSVPLGKMIVLDLQSEQFPQYERLQSYFGQPFIWCMLHNFGGTLGMFGSSEIINSVRSKFFTRPFHARAMTGSTMIGMGVTPEGINQNYVIYDLMMEMFWRKKPILDLSLWFGDYATRRYGKENGNATRSWQILQETIYNFQSFNRMRGKFVYNRSPSTKLLPWTWYDPDRVELALLLLINAKPELRSNANYRHDCIDLFRQVLQNNIDFLYMDMMRSFQAKNVELFGKLAKKFLSLFDDIERILSMDAKYLLGLWLRDASKWAENDAEKALYEYNARNQITLWGPDGQIMDYANKQWSGIVKDYFRPRWQLFISHMNDSISNGVKFNEQAARRDIFEMVEKPFTFSNKTYPTGPQGDFFNEIFNEKL